MNAASFIVRNLEQVVVAAIKQVVLTIQIIDIILKIDNYFTLFNVLID